MLVVTLKVDLHRSCHCSVAAKMPSAGARMASWCGRRPPYRLCGLGALRCATFTNILMLTCSGPMSFIRSDQQGHPDHAGIVDANGRRTARVKGLTEEQKKAIQAMNQPSDMDNKERKRQMAAMDRYIASNKATLPPGILEKYKDCFGNGQKKFELLRLLRIGTPCLPCTQQQTSLVRMHPNRSQEALDLRQLHAVRRSGGLLHQHAGEGAGWRVSGKIAHGLGADLHDGRAACMAAKDRCQSLPQSTGLGLHLQMPSRYMLFYKPSTLELAQVKPEHRIHKTRRIPGPVCTRSLL